MRHSISVASAIALLLTTVEPASAAPGYSVVVVGSRSTLRRDVRTRVRRQVEKSLENKVNILTNDDYVRLALNQGYDSSALAAPDVAAAVAAELDATHVLILEGKRKAKKRRRRATHIGATLVDVGTGEFQRIGKFRMGKGRLRRAGSSQLLAALRGALEASAPMPDRSQIAAAEPIGSDAGAPEPAPKEAPELASSEPVEQSVSPDWTENSVSTGPVEVAGPLGRKNPNAMGLSLAVGGLGFSRDCSIFSGASESSALEYRTDGFLPGIATQVELFPAAFGRHASALEGLGLHARGRLSRVASSDQASSASAAADLVWMADGGITYRKWLGQRTFAPAMALRVGYSAFSFPVRNAPFPSVGYSGPRADLELSLALASAVVLYGEGTYSMPLVLSAESETLGALQRAGTQVFGGEAGIRIRIGVVELSGGARYEMTTLTFAGQSQAPGVTTLNNARLEDRVLSGWVSLGLVLN